MKKLRVISLFAGIGGFDLGLERTGGFHTVAVAELDPYASRVLALRFPDAPNVGDVTTAEYPDADVICAGFPCQDLSYAGAGAGLAGSRSGLFWEVVRAARVVRPRLVILENVAALLGRGLDVVLRALAEIGYDAEWHCIPASAIGAPHRRDRIWIVCHANGQGEPVGAFNAKASWLSRHPISGELAAQLADTEAMFGQTVEWGEPDGNHASLGALADADEGARGRHTGGGRLSPHVADPEGQPEWAGLCADEASEEWRGRPGDCRSQGGWWASEPDVGRVAHGVPSRVDRLRCLGNAVVPQIPELIGNAILASLAEQKEAA